MKAEPMANGRRMILVLGMHRSGTSAVAGTLAHLGVDFGERLVAATVDNPKGYFEHVDVWQQDHALLQALGSEWDDTLPLPAAWPDGDAVRHAHAEVRAILQRDFAAATLAGLKDPRMCRLVPAWRDWLQQEGFVTSVVLTVRRPAEVVASLSRRDGLLPDHAAWVWLRHVLEAEAATRGLSRSVLLYEDLLRDWRGETARMAHELALSWPRAMDAAAPVIDAFLEPTLRHYRSASGSVLVAEPLQGWLRRTYAALAAGEVVDTDALDTIAAEIARADGQCVTHAAVLRATRLGNLKTANNLRWCDGERQQLTLANTDLREGNVWLEGEKAGLEREKARLERENTGLQQESAGLQQERALLGQDLARHVARLAELDATLSAIYTSRSWQLTRPLRGAARLARRLAGRSPAEDSPVTGQSVAAVGPAGDPAATLAAAFAAATGPRVLIVTPDILGPIRNGGIGTAFGALAMTLARAGHAVTVVYTLGGYCEGGEDIAHWERHYAALGIRFVPAWLERGEPQLDAPHYAWRAYRVYQWLKQHQGDYDLAYFPEWKGEAYYALQAKHVGLDFARLRMIVVTHSSTRWADSGNYILPQRFDELSLGFLERRSTEMADAVISPSQYMVDWMHQRGWRWSAPTHVIQNLMPEPPATAPAADQSGAVIVEWVFFGRLERRKGLLVFLAALRQVPAEMRKRIQLTFLGKAVVTPQFDSAAVIAGQLADWPRPPRLIMDYSRDQALAYLRQPGRVAVIASLVENSPYTVLECVLQRIPFVAADVGGIAELIHPDDRARSLFKPTPVGLAAVLQALDGHHYVPPRPAVAAILTEQRWLALQDQLLQEIPVAAAEPEAPPHITVCLVHHDRPALLARAIDSLRAQTYRDYDVVLVDDGSRSPPAQQYLDSLADEFAWRGWTIVRQANAYLGAARNAAARHAQGEYLLFMDDDNLAKPDELAVFAHAARHSGADILTAVSDVFSDADHAGQPPAASRQLWLPLGNAAGLGVFRNVFGDANALVRRSTFEALGGYTEDYGIGHEDWEFFAKAALAGVDLQLVPEPLFWYRVSSGGMLRAGQTDINHARSVRPYREGFDNGVGSVLAYASHLERHAPAAAAPPRPSLLRVATGVFRASDRARFRELLNSLGWRATLGRALRYIGRIRLRR